MRRAYSSAWQQTQRSAETRVEAVCVARIACCRRRIRSVCLAWRMLRDIALRGEEWKRAYRARRRACVANAACVEGALPAYATHARQRALARMHSVCNVCVGCVA
jgi:hypothetical protein